MKYAKLEITTELSFLEEFFKGIDDDIYNNMPDIIIEHELEGDYAYFEGQEAWSEINIISIEIDNKDDYTDSQLQMICEVFDDQWHRFSKEFECELGESWTEYIKSYYGY